MIPLHIIVAMFAQCTAAAPYDDCAPAFEAARANPDAREVVYWVDRVFSDPVLYGDVYASMADPSW